MPNIYNFTSIEQRESLTKAETGSN